MRVISFSTGHNLTLTSLSVTSIHTQLITLRYYITVNSLTMMANPISSQWTSNFSFFLHWQHEACCSAPLLWLYSNKYLFLFPPGTATSRLHILWMIINTTCKSQTETQREKIQYHCRAQNCPLPCNNRSVTMVTLAEGTQKEEEGGIEERRESTAASVSTSVSSESASLGGETWDTGDHFWHSSPSFGVPLKPYVLFWAVNKHRLSIYPIFAASSCVDLRAADLCQVSLVVTNL